MQLLYLSIVLAQSFWASSDLLKSMHSSRMAFSSLHTQHGYGLLAPSAVMGHGELHTFGPEAGLLSDLSGAATAALDAEAFQQSIVILSKALIGLTKLD